MKPLCDMTIEELSYLRDHGIIEAEAVNDEIMTRKAKEFQEKYHYWKTSMQPCSTAHRKVFVIYPHSAFVDLRFIAPSLGFPR